jgi:hypothetical protein
MNGVGVDAVAHALGLEVRLTFELGLGPGLVAARSGSCRRPPVVQSSPLSHRGRRVDRGRARDDFAIGSTCLNSIGTASPAPDIYPAHARSRVSGRERPGTLAQLLARIRLCTRG